ncbi:MAG: DUF1571 domain-containing protein [Chitinophagales bacterium]|nr:DUF1571 domain-containing protein [Chitinophagales bacterium]
MKKITILLSAFITLFAVNAQAQSVESILTKSLSAMKSVSTCTYDFYSKERFSNGKVISSHIEFKVQESPKKIYANSLEPQKAELCYIPSTSSKVMVKKGFLKLNLEKTNNLLMKEQHQTIDRAGFKRIADILQTSVNQRKGQDLSKFATVSGTVTYDGKSCYKITINEPDYKIVYHTVKSGQTNIWKLGEALAIPEYKVQELNNTKSDDFTVGQKIKVPSAYAKTTVIYVDKSTYLPLYIKMDDDKGLFEQYEFKNLKTGVSFSSSDFPNFK